MVDNKGLIANKRKDSCPSCGNPKKKISKICKECQYAGTRSLPNYDLIQVEGEPCRLLPLTQGLYAIVDAILYDWLISWRWFAAKTEHSFYAGRHVVENGHTRCIYMHQLLVPEDSKEVDHHNGNGLDNRRSNLRPATRRENGRNLKLASNNTSGYKGVTWARTGWQAQLKIRSGGGSTTLYLGKYADPKIAACAYDEAAKQHFGEFARLNFPEVTFG